MCVGGEGAGLNKRHSVCLYRPMGGKRAKVVKNARAYLHAIRKKKLTGDTVHVFLHLKRIVTDAVRRIEPINSGQ